MADACWPTLERNAALARKRHGRSPHLRKVMTRLLFLSCFGVGDFSVLHGRHALASPRSEPAPAPPRQSARLPPPVLAHATAEKPQPPGAR